MNKAMAATKLFVLLLFALVYFHEALVHHLKIHRDDRKIFKIETFGFVRGGRMELMIRNFKIHLTNAEKLKYGHEAENGLGGSILQRNSDGSTGALSAAITPKAVPSAPVNPKTQPATPTAQQAQPVTSVAPKPQPATPAVQQAQPVTSAAAKPQPVTPAVQQAQPVTSVAPKPQPATPTAQQAQPVAAPKPLPAPPAVPQPSSASVNPVASMAKPAAVAQKPVPVPPVSPKLPPVTPASAAAGLAKTARSLFNAVGAVAELNSLRSRFAGRLAAEQSSAASSECVGANRKLEAATGATSDEKHGKGLGSEVKEVMHERHKYLVGFVMRKSSSESDAQADLENLIEKEQCIIEHMNEDDLFIDLSDPNDWKSYAATQEVGLEGAGLYSLIFARCAPHGQHYVEFELDAVFYNPGWGMGSVNYLSAGDVPLPKLYLVFFLLFSAALVAWALLLRHESRGTVHRIHYMMLALLVVKCLSLLFESIRFHYIALLGASELWSLVYYIFAFVKGIMLFTVILLIGSGWSLMKSYLNEKEKRIVYSVLILQVLDNIAMIVLEETAPGSQGWLTWRDILHLVDIICCCAILLPIVWSIRHLRMAAETDGKAYNAVVKLQLFRQFYVMVVAYIYFTRIVVYLLAATIPYYLLWLGPLASETATLIFYVITGYKFRPAPDNPYLPVRSEDLEGEEYGLEESGDDGFELMGNVGARSGSATAHVMGRPGSLK